VLKAFFLKVFQLVALTLLIAQISFSSAIAQETQPSEATNNQSSEVVKPNKVNVPASEKPTPKDSKATPTDKNKKAPAVSAPRVAFPQPPHPYDTEAIEKFNEELYGKGN
jgi:hypothetical protein